MEYENGSVLSMTPATGTVIWMAPGDDATDAREIETPLIGWAVVVYEGYWRNGEQKSVTAIEPVVLWTHLADEYVSPKTESEVRALSTVRIARINLAGVQS